jgi:WD40 repeat protein
LWDVEPPAALPGITNVSGPFVFSSDGRRLVTQSTNGLARLWALPNRQLINEWQEPPFQSAVFLTNGLLLAASRGESNKPARLCVVDPANGMIRTDTPLSGLEAVCTAAAIAPDGRIAVTGHADGSVGMWEAQTGRLLHAAPGQFEVEGRPSAVDVLAISANGRRVFAASFFRVQIRTWALPDFQALGNVHLGAAYPVQCAVAPNGRQIATAGNGQGLAINLWDDHLHGPEPRLSGQSDFPNALAYAPDGRTIVAAGLDGQLKLWHLPTERELGTLMTLPMDVRYVRLAFSRDGSWLGVSDTTGALHLFYAPGPLEN